ncbi:ABC transporter ATP-binding protein [Rubrobacter xylanophilus]|uniref:ABC-type quaternary amine transporter n=2 Tax=Rubrobacter xylanophilus TaxID=49319 RepID=A0A510HFC0_9ACTN|nr:ABC transporter ATP-binding protein [Rubrobacter xylanophilus]
MSAMVRLEGVGRRYGTVRAVEDLNLEVDRGEILALLGPSGCGKTTTLRLIAGFEPPDEGRIEISGRRVAGAGAFVPPERRRVGMVFQDYALFPHLTVRQNVAYGLARDEKRNSRLSAVIRLARLEGLEDRMPHELSGGQQQRVALARALAPEPAVVLLDEPFSNLDAALRARVRAEMRRILLAAGTTAVFVTHDQEEALSLADRVAVMFDGRVLQAAAPEELYERPADPRVARFVGEANLLRATASGGRALCALGEVPLREPASGPVEIMLRPEQLLVDPSPDGPAEVLEREFYGHDQLVRLRLPDGERVEARLPGSRRLRPGGRVTVRVASPAVAFPRPAH